jgi:hypothetical protein
VQKLHRIKWLLKSDINMCCFKQKHQQLINHDDSLAPKNLHSKRFYGALCLCFIGDFFDAQSSN